MDRDDPTSDCTEGAPSGGGIQDAPESTFTLRVVDGPERGATFPIGGAAAARVVLGTGALADVRLTGRRVSRMHVAFAIDGSALVVTDLGSKNGTWIGALRVREAELRGGEQLTIGESVVAVESGPLVAAALSTAARFGDLLGQSRAMRRLYPLLQKLAETSIPVILQGEAGTGKELLAEALHAAGPRRAGPFVVFDPATIPASQLELVLFGHAAGVLTGGAPERRGAFEEAQGGTLLLKDVAELDLSLQARLLRTLERSRTQRVGGGAPVAIDVRVLVATRRDLDREVQAGRFRDDLFHRLAVARVELPPLRKRNDDIGLLAEAFAAEAGSSLAQIAPAALDAWRDAPWPGNVRELRQQVARHIALGGLAPLSYAPPAEVATSAPGSTDWLESILDEKLPLVEARDKVVSAFEGRYVARMLHETGGNVVRAAARAGIARRYFQILKAKHTPRQS